MKLQIFQVDAFTSEPFGGNPAAVVPLDAWLPPETMQAIALENNLSETAFFVPGGDGQYEIRWFTPTFEIDLCGHATLASAFTIFEVLKLESNIVNFHSHKSGKLSVEKNGDVLTLDFPSRPVSPAEAPDGLIEAIGKMPSSGQHHGHSARLGNGGGLRVANRSTRLNDSDDARIGRGLDAIGKWEERIAGKHTSGSSLAGRFGPSDTHRCAV